jgi:hypothetical protein
MIHKAWWFELYSLPLLKRTLKFFAMAFVGDYLLTLLGFSLELGIALFCLPCIPFAGLVFMRIPSISQNLDFHKLHIPLRQLRKEVHLNFFVDFLLLNLVLLFLYFFSGAINGSIHRSVSLVFQERGFFNLLFIYSFIIVTLFYFLTMDKNPTRRKEALAVFNSTTLRKWGFMIYIFFASMPFLAFNIFTMDAFEAIFFLGLTGVLGAHLREIRMLFHTLPAKATYKIHFKHFMAGGLCSFGIYLMCATGARFDVSDYSLTPEQRATSFSFSGMLAPEVDFETFKVIEPRLYDSELLYSKVNFDPSTLGVDFFLSKNGTHRLYSFLKVGNPSEEFLITLYDHFETNPYWTDKKVEGLKYLAFSKWPSSAHLPERFLAAKESSKENLAAVQRKKEISRRHASSKSED